MRTPATRTNHRRSRTPFVALSIVVVVATTACGQSEDTTGSPLEGSRWEMTSVRDGDALIAANPTTIATAVFSNGQASGSTGCNLYQAPYSVNSDSITFGDPAQTGSACAPGHTVQGNAFIRAMQATERFVISADSLELTDAAGAAQIMFRPVSESPLTWVAWQLVWYGGGTSPLEGTQISLAFRDDGLLTGIAGCNSYSADYQIDGDQLVIGAIARTEMACMHPEGVMIQETGYLSALDRAVAFTATLTGLELIDADGTRVAEYRFGGRIRDDVSGATDGDPDLEEAENHRNRRADRNVMTRTWTSGRLATTPRPHDNPK